MRRHFLKVGKIYTMGSKFKELYVLPGAASNFIAYMAMYGEPVNMTMTGNRQGIANEYDIWREKSPFVFTQNIQKISIKNMHKEGKQHCWNCGFPHNKTYQYGNSQHMWLQDKLRNEFPHAWGRGQSFSAGRKPWVEEFVERHKDKPGHELRKIFLEDQWDQIGLYDTTMYIASFLGYEDDMDKWISKCINLRYAIAIEQGIDPYVITHYHPKIHFKYLKMPDAIDFNTMSITIDKDEDIELVNKIHYRKRPEAFMSEGLNSMRELSDKNKEFSDTSIDYRDLFIEPKQSSIRELYKFFDNEKLFDSEPNYIVSKFKAYHLINLGLLEDVKSK